ncbi:DUF368 domain-containing protein [Aestuariirhabdus sp. Z084]|uniref:DUF368 domain-containing protein n=1 Tax=Aestuariirhabdus haliotis TaxID=2918751 RepID=UPI00201B3BB5|nr:DUF368 domain-containing protein [Aestuariirhabdus haliotis]MCL6416357.1 DUF368 domain-containing protein [Aestuariirhabdus haliotis]MCL6420346.1 DUF368 domain-containing protein [Aestuariirhabdus haliotis]
MNQWRQRIALFAKGMTMGAADVVPGVSGGTMALITGIYDRLLEALSRFDLRAVGLLRKAQIGPLWRYIDGGFLLTLFSGVLLSILSLARVITFLLQTYPEMLWSFFFGLILVSAVYVARSLERWNPAAAIALLAGTALAWFITVAQPLQLTPDLPTLFVAGAIAVCAMILPGISGSFILLLLGLYAPVLAAIKGFELSVLATVAAGCVVGLLSFSRLLNWLLHHFHGVTMAFLCGLMLGSLNKVWPWKETLSFRQNSAGEMVPLLQKNVSPWHFEAQIGPAHLGESLALMLFAIILVLILTGVAVKTSQTD